MKEDIEEIKEIIKEITEAGLFPGDSAKALDAAIQIQKNRILRKAFVIKWTKSPHSNKVETSIFEYFDQTFIEGFQNLKGSIEDLGMK